MGYELEVDIVIKEKKLVSLTIDKYVGIKIRIIRTERGQSQQDLAEKLNIGRSSISNIEKGKQSVTLKNLEGICNALGCTSSDILPI